MRPALNPLLKSARGTRLGETSPAPSRRARPHGQMIFYASSRSEVHILIPRATLTKRVTTLKSHNPPNSEGAQGVNPHLSRLRTHGGQGPCNHNPPGVVFMHHGPLDRCLFPY